MGRLFRRRYTPLTLTKIKLRLGFFLSALAICSLGFIHKTSDYKFVSALFYTSEDPVSYSQAPKEYNFQERSFNARRNLETIEELHEECAAAFPDECAPDLCLTSTDVEGACCLASSLDNLTKAETCFTSEGEICPFKELCLAELVPGSGVGAECFQDFEKTGGIPLYVFLLLYMFLALAIVCDDYFTYSLDMLAELLQVSSDVKGATFAAIGSSAPELFVSLADNVISNPPKSVGVGTIVGSAIFNILIIIGLSGVWAGFRESRLTKLALKQHKKGKLNDDELAAKIIEAETFLNWRPLARDSVFYTISIAALILVAITGNEALFYEGLILLILYGFYLAFMKYNERIFKRIDDKFGFVNPNNKEAEFTTEKNVFALKDGKVVTKSAGSVDPVRQLSSMEDEEGGDEGNEAMTITDSGRVLPRQRRSSVALNLGGGKAQIINEDDMSDQPYFENLYWPMFDPNEVDANEDDDTKEDLHDETPKDKIKISKLAAVFGGGKDMWFRRSYYLLILPINIAFRLTIPDARWDLFGEDDKKTGDKKHRRIAYWAEFFMCIFHIALLSHFLVFAAAKLGCLLGIPPAVMGLTVLAAGTSVPDAITSIILTKNGEGDAAVANSIGSNVFDILVGLGLPWFLAGLVYGQAEIATGDIEISIAFLFGVLIVLLLVLTLTKFRLNRTMGWGLVVLYIFYVIFELFIHPRI